MAANPIVSADDYSSQWEAKFWGKEGGLKAGDFFDTAGASPALTHLLASGGVDLAGKRAFIPGCGRGYDVIAFLRAGAAESVGLELAPTAQREAQQYLEEQLTEEERARAQVFAGDFFTWQHPSVPTWDVGYDYTFFCALHPSMRQDWAAGWARLLAPGSRLVCLAFPLDHGTQTGPPWPVAVQDYRQLLEPVGFVLESEETVPPERSHSKRKNKECMLVFQRQ